MMGIVIGWEQGLSTGENYYPASELETEGVVERVDRTTLPLGEASICQMETYIPVPERNPVVGNQNASRDHSGMGRSPRGPAGLGSTSHAERSHRGLVRGLSRLSH